MDISQLAQFGVAGLAVFLFYKLASNHISHNTNILAELRDAINLLTEYLKEHHKK